MRRDDTRAIRQIFHNHRLHVRIGSHERQYAIIASYKRGNKKAGELMLASHIFWMIEQVRCKLPPAVDSDEVVQIALWAMSIALDRFNVNIARHYNAKFGTYAQSQILDLTINLMRRAMFPCALVGDKDDVRGALPARDMFKAYTLCREAKQQDLPFEETVAHVSQAFSPEKHMGVRAFVTQLYAVTISLDQSVNDDEGDGSDLHALFPDDVPTPEDILSDQEEQVSRNSLLKSLLNMLTPREQYVIRERRLFDPDLRTNAVRPSLRKLGIVLRVTPERVRQIEARALEKLAGYGPLLLQEQNRRAVY